MGLGEEVRGVICDSKGEEVTSFRSAMMGMGTFGLFVLPGETYHAVCETEGGTIKRVDQRSRNRSRVIAMRQVRGQASVSLLEGTESGGGPVSLLLHNKGVVLYHEPWGPGRESLVSLLPPPSGVSSILLLDENLNILSERMFFNLNEVDFARVTLRDTLPSYKRRELVSLRLQLENSGDTTSYSNMAISVVDANAVPTDSVRQPSLHAVCVGVEGLCGVTRPLPLGGKARNGGTAP